VNHRIDRRRLCALHVGRFEPLASAPSGSARRWGGFVAEATAQASSQERPVGSSTTRYPRSTVRLFGRRASSRNPTPDRRDPHRPCRDHREERLG
jgi:hypothetical protein